MYILMVIIGGIIALFTGYFWFITYNATKNEANWNNFWEFTQKESSWNYPEEETFKLMVRLRDISSIIFIISILIITIGIMLLICFK